MTCFPPVEVASQGFYFWVGDGSANSMLSSKGARAGPKMAMGVAMIFSRGTLFHKKISKRFSKYSNFINFVKIFKKFSKTTKNLLRKLLKMNFLAYLSKNFTHPTFTF